MSRKIKRIANVILLILTWFVTTTLAYEDPEKIERWQEGKKFVRETLRNLHQGISGRVEGSVKANKEQEIQNAKAHMEILGFESNAQEAFLKAPDPLENIKVGEPFGMYYVRLDHLLKYPTQPEKNPWNLLIRTNGVMYPIVVQDQEKGEQVQSAVTLLDQGSEKSDMSPWELLEIGSSKEIKLFTDARAEILKEQKTDPFLIFIPALSQVLIGIKDSANFKVKILGSSMKLNEKLDSSNFRPAGEIFKELAEKARTTNYDLPPRG